MATMSINPAHPRERLIRAGTMTDAPYAAVIAYWTVDAVETGGSPGYLAVTVLPDEARACTLAQHHHDWIMRGASMPFPSEFRRIGRAEIVPIGAEESALIEAHRAEVFGRPGRK